jgi:5,10-methylene-tetrahydrofolate dehydrogenase/methenyl tetrahydrofolate cyclohydrolase
VVPDFLPDQSLLLVLDTMKENDLGVAISSSILSFFIPGGVGPPTCLSLLKNYTI